MAPENIFEIVKDERDIVDCDQIPIRYPGEIQSYAFVLGYELATQRLLFFSNNLRQWFNDIPNPLSGSLTLEVVFGPELSQFLLASMQSNREGGRAFRVPGKLVRLAVGEEIWATPSISGKVGYVEFEKTWSASGPAMDSQAMAFHFSSIEYLSNEMFFQALTDVCFKIAPSERIMLYRFDDDWNGEVVAETCEESRKRFLHHWFPASDIPKQVREQYLVYPMRQICDVSASAVGLTTTDERLPSAIDLSRFVSRGVARVHQEYLLNMDVHSSFSIAVFAGGKLWGLIAIHHSCPRVLSPETRAMLHGLALLAGCRIGELEACDRLLSHTQRQETLLYLQEQAPKNEVNLELARQLLSAEAVVYFSDEERIGQDGEALGSGQIEALRQLFESRKRGTRGSFSFNRHDQTDETADEVGFPGILGTYWQVNRKTYYFAWLRRSVVEKRSWGGNPMKPSDLLPGRGRIHPRKSFESWVESHSKAPQPWTPTDLHFAEQYARSLEMASHSAAQQNQN